MSAPSKAGPGPCVLVVCLVLAGTAHAQDQPPPAAAPADDNQTTHVTVTAKTKPVRRTAEGTVYDESNNPKGQSGTAGDVLNTVPSVSVTPDGNLTLRGDGNVQIYVDGKPSVLMKGDARALTLESMPGSAIASVEVITNPSAKYDANGGGIINITLKKQKKAGAYGSLTLNQGNDGRKNASLSADFVTQRLSLHAQLAVREDLRPKTEATDTRWLGATLGDSRQTSEVNSRRQSSLALLSAGYAASDLDQLTLEASYKENHSANLLNEYHQDYDVSGDLIDGYDRRSMGPRHQDNETLSGAFSHKGPAGDEFRLQAQAGWTTNTLDKSYTNIFSDPVTPDTGVHVLTRSDQGFAELSGDGVVPAGDDRQLSYGFDLQAARDVFSNVDAAVDPVSGVETIDTDLTNAFRVDQSIAASYLTYQVQLKRLTVLAGLRAEVTGTQIAGDGQAATRDTFVNLIPTLHLAWRLDAARQLTASASEGFQRPDPRDLDPFMTYVDAQNVTSGNPDLKPQRVTSFETGYTQDKGDDSFGLTGYYKATRDTVTDYSSFLSNGLLLTTKRNSGDGQSLGMEYEQTGKLDAKWSYNLSANVFHTRLEADDPGGPSLHAGTSYIAKVGLDYDSGNANQVSLESNAIGRAVTAQGWHSGTILTDLSWRHRLTPKISTFVNFDDIANGSKVTTVRQTATLGQVDQVFIKGQQLFVGLKISFGGSSTH